MPTYTYQCKTCEATVDVFHAMSAQPKVTCPECGKACTRLVGMGSGIIFKGSGFYETDYKKDGGKTGTHKSKETKAESKSAAAKTESKSEKPAASATASSTSGSRAPTCSAPPTWRRGAPPAVRRRTTTGASRWTSRCGRRGSAASCSRSTRRGSGHSLER